MPRPIITKVTIVGHRVTFFVNRRGDAGQECDLLPAASTAQPTARHACRPDPFYTNLAAGSYVLYVRGLSWNGTPSAWVHRGFTIA